MLPLQFDELLAAGAITPETAAAVDSLSTNVSKDLKSLEGLSLDVIIQKLINGMVDFAFHLAIAILVFYVGKFIISKIYKIIDTIFIRRQLDRSLSSFILSMVRIVLYFILIVTVVGILGIETSSFLALFASAGVAIGLALSGTLQNFAGGVLILLLKPYKVGDYIDAQGYSGTVKEIQMFHTMITTFDNRAILIPNGALSTSSINNASREQYRRVQWEVGISYGDDVDNARSVILDLLLADDRIIKMYLEDDMEKQEEQEEQEEMIEKDRLDKEYSARGFWYKLFHRRSKVSKALDTWREKRKEKLDQLKPRTNCAPAVFVNSLGDSSVNLVVRAWVRSENYWPVFFHFNEAFYNTLPQHGINFPFPQMDVHVTGQQA